jgi:hypothetical protein
MAYFTIQWYYLMPWKTMNWSKDRVFHWIEY